MSFVVGNYTETQAVKSVLSSKCKSLTFSYSSHLNANQKTAWRFMVWRLTPPQQRCRFMYYLVALGIVSSPHNQWQNANQAFSLWQLTESELSQRSPNWCSKSERISVLWCKSKLLRFYARLTFRNCAFSRYFGVIL